MWKLFKLTPTPNLLCIRAPQSMRVPLKGSSRLGLWEAGPLLRGQFLRVPSCLWGSLGQVGLRCRGRTGSPLRLGYLGDTTESRSWAGLDRSMTERPWGQQTALQRPSGLGRADMP